MDFRNAALADAVFAQSRDALCLLAPDRSVLRTNNTWLRYVGTMFDPPNDDIFTEGANELVYAVRACADEKSVIEIPCHMRRLNGYETPWEGSVAPIAMEGGTGMLITVSEVPCSEAKKKAVESLKTMSGILAEGARIAHLGTFQYIVDTKTTIWSEEEFRIYGLDPTGPSPTYKVLIQNCIHPDDAALLHETFMNALRTSSVFELEHRIVRPDGEVRFVYDWAHPHFDEAGKLVRYVGATLDITDRKRAEEALRANEARLRAVFGALTEGIVFVNVHGEVEEVNEAVTARYGFTLANLVDTNTDPRGRVVRADGTPFPVDEQPGIVVLRTGQPVADVEMGIPTPDGQLRWRVVNAQPVRDEQGTLLGAVASFFDITERKRAEEALRESEQRLRAANEQLREADRRKDEFLGMLSHELRNPLAPIRNALYILDHVEPTSQQAHRAKDIANRQILHLARLIDDLLDVTRITRGKVELRRHNVDLMALARRTAEDYRTVIRERGLDLVVTGPDNAVLVNGDETRLAQVLGNLLSNAAKFTPAGGRITIAVQTTSTHAIVQVRDTGVGIPPELLPTIFDAFVQAHQTLARTEGGLGLGLALVKGLTELHGGHVSVASVPGKGTEFTIKLPLAPVSSSAGF